MHYTVIHFQSYLCKLRHNSLSSIRSLILGLLCFVAAKSYGQDPRFSQFYVAPMYFNPALAGTYDGSFRTSAIYRDQWTGALNNSLSTFLVSGDVSFDINGRRSKEPDKFSGGLAFYSDRVATFDLNTNSISLYGAYHKVLNERDRHILSGGLQFGMTQRSINYEDLQFGDQFNGLDGYTLSTGENLPANNLGHFDFGLGINYAIAPVGGTQFYAGIGIFHLNGANISFYRQDNRVDPDLQRESILLQRFTAQVGMSVPTSQLLAVQPRVLYMKQGQHTEIDLGTNLRYKLNQFDDVYLHFGPWLRVVQNEDNLGLESFVLSAAYEKGSFIFGFSYDHNYNDLTGSRSGLNAFEFSVTFIGDHNNDTDICPKF